MTSPPVPPERGDLWRLVAPAAACGAVAGLLEAGRGLLGRLPEPAAETAAAAGLAVVAYATATAVAALLLSAARGRPARPLAAAAAIAVAVAFAAARLRALLGLAQIELTAFALGPLLEGALAGGIVYGLLARVPERWLRPTLRGLAALGLVAVLVAGARAPLGDRPAAAGAGASRPNLLLVSVDTLRADHLGVYGGPAGLTPELDRLAEDGVTFLRAASPIALTGPSHTTMLTGLEPARHGTIRNGVKLAGGVATIAETLRRAGYRTGGFVSGVPLTQGFSGLGSRFGHWDEDFSSRAWRPGAADAVPMLWLLDRTIVVATGWWRTDGHLPPPVDYLFERPGAHTVERALDWIAKRPERPFFAFVHLYEPHRPYAPSPQRLRALGPDPTGIDRLETELEARRFRELVADPAAAARIRRLYGAEVGEADALVGRLLAGLERLGRAERTFVVFTSDHGEGLGEHGEQFDHGDFVYQTTLHVPLLLRWPDRRFAGRRFEGLVRLADVAPTLLAVAGLAPDGDLDGSSLLPRLAGAAPVAEPALVFASSDPRGPQWTVRHAVRTPRYKLIWTVDERGLIDGEPALEELFDLESDPHELRNLLPTETTLEIVAQLREALRAAIQETRTAVPAIDPEAAERLRSLGYL